MNTLRRSTPPSASLFRFCMFRPSEPSGARVPGAVVFEGEIHPAIGHDASLDGLAKRQPAIGFPEFADPENLGKINAIFLDPSRNFVFFSGGSGGGIPCPSHQATSLLEERRIFPRDLCPGFADPELQNRFDLGEFHPVDIDPEVRAHPDDVGEFLFLGQPGIAPLHPKLVAPFSVGQAIFLEIGLHFGVKSMRPNSISGAISD